MKRADLDFEIDMIAVAAGIGRDAALLVFQDLAVEAAGAASRARLAYDDCLRLALDSFSDGLRATGDVLQAHTEACARLDARVILKS